MTDLDKRKERIERVSIQLLSAVYTKYGAPRSGVGLSERGVLQAMVSKVIKGAEELIRQIDEKYPEKDKVG